MQLTQNRLYHLGSIPVALSLFADSLGSDGIHIFATSLLFGPTVLSFSFFHDSECPTNGIKPCEDAKSSWVPEIM